MRSETVTAADLEVEWIGSGPTVVLVHGSIVDAQRTWRHQRGLAKHWALCLPNRPGFAGSPPLARGDFALEAPAIAELLGGGAHLVGHSYGGVIALLAATQALGDVRSLVVSEPGLLRIAAGNPAVDTMIEHGDEMYRNAQTMEPAEFLRIFRAGVHSAHETPEQLPDWLERGARMAARERPPWEAEVALDDLAGASFPKLVISGGHSPVFEAVCDELAQRIGAERAIVTGRGHTIPATGEDYNRCLEGFWAGPGRGAGASSGCRARPSG